MISPKTAVCAVFDIGKTNKKAFVFDEDYRIVFEKTAQFPETADDDGDPCEDLFLLKNWILETAEALRRNPDFHIAAVNCTAYGASFVHLDADFQPVAPIYNYLKPFPADLQNRFLEQYGPADKLALETASPLLGHLNSGLQLLWLKYRKPFIFNKIHTSLHLPQWVAFLLAKVFQPFAAGRRSPAVSDLTSIGCHTLLWDFGHNDYHRWVKAEGIAEKLPPFGPLVFAPTTDAQPHVGTGLHDSSAALMPYSAAFREPFVLISTGTWCISLNPFNDDPLAPAELARDCLCYLTAGGKPVKAARYFGGYEHEQAVRKLAGEYGLPFDFFQKKNRMPDEGSSPDCQNAMDGYAEFMRQLVRKQVASTRLVLGGGPVSRIFVDGGFSKNELYMRLLAASFPLTEVFAADVAQATALGAALAIHPHWNTKPLPLSLIDLKKYSI